MASPPPASPSSKNDHPLTQLSQTDARGNTHEVPHAIATRFIQAFFRFWLDKHEAELDSAHPQIKAALIKLLEQNKPYSKYIPFLIQATEYEWHLRGIRIKTDSILLNATVRRMYAEDFVQILKTLDREDAANRELTTTLTSISSPSPSYLEAVTTTENTARLEILETTVRELTQTTQTSSEQQRQKIQELEATIKQQADTIDTLKTDMRCQENISEEYEKTIDAHNKDKDDTHRRLANITNRVEDMSTRLQDMSDTSGTYAHTTTAESLAHILDKMTHHAADHDAAMTRAARAHQDDIDSVAELAYDSTKELRALCNEARQAITALKNANKDTYRSPRNPYTPQDVRAHTVVTPARHHQPSRQTPHPRSSFNPYDTTKYYEEESDSEDMVRSPHSRRIRSFPDRVATNCYKFSKVTLTAKLAPHTVRDRPAAAMAFYTNIRSQAMQCGIGLRPWDDLDTNTEDYYVASDSNLTPDEQKLERDAYMVVIGHKTLDGVTCPHLKNTLLQQMGTHNDGYRVLRSLVLHYVPNMQRPHDFTSYAKHTGRPTFDSSRTLHAFQTDLSMWYKQERQYGRTYLDGEKTSVFLAGIEHDKRFEQAIVEARRECPADYSAAIPSIYQLGNIADTMASKASLDPAVGPDAYTGLPTVHTMEADADDDDDPTVNRTFDRKRRKRPHVQCDRCQRYGHQGKCDKPFELMVLLEWLEAHPEEAKQGKVDYIARNKPMQKSKVNAAIADMAKAFGQTIDMDNLTDAQQRAIDAVGATIAVCQVIDKGIQDKPEVPDFEDPAITNQLNPKALKTVHIAPAPEYITYDHEIEEDDASAPQVTRMVCTFPPSATQGDTGANRGLTNDRNKLTSFQEIEPFPIGTIGPTNIIATGQGIMSLPTIEGHQEQVKAFYSPAASGSVISPDRHVRESSGRLQRWLQWGDPETGQGAIVFLNRACQHESTIRMYSRNGLWYAGVESTATPPDPPNPRTNSSIRHAQTETAEFSTELTFHAPEKTVVQETARTIQHIQFELPEAIDNQHQGHGTVSLTQANTTLESTPFIAKMETSDHCLAPSKSLQHVFHTNKEGTRVARHRRLRHSSIKGSLRIYHHSRCDQTSRTITPAIHPQANTLATDTTEKSKSPIPQGRRRIHVRGTPFRQHQTHHTKFTFAELILTSIIFTSITPWLLIWAMIQGNHMLQLFQMHTAIGFHWKRHTTKPTPGTRITNIGKLIPYRHGFNVPQQIARKTIYQHRLQQCCDNWCRKTTIKQARQTFRHCDNDTGYQPDTENQGDNRETDDPWNTVDTVDNPPIICAMEAQNVPAPTSQLMTEIWHQRMGHIGLEALKHTAKCTEGMVGVGKEHPLFKCQACQMAKMTKATKTKRENREATTRGERFHMDFGFIRGPKHLAELTTRTWTGKRQHKEDDHPNYHPLITSHDGYTSYLLIVDAYTRLSFVFPTKTKEPPIDTIRLFLTKYGIKDNPNCTIRTDQGGELARSAKFRETVATMGYSVEPTGADNSSQNGRGERPHRTLANMVRCLLYSTTLGAEFWSDALLYACYIYNRTYHKSIKKTPFEAWSGKRPNLKHIRTFGTPVTVKRPGRRPSKLHPHVYHGIFLRFTGTQKNIVYYDITTGTVKTATHKQHDEFQYSSDNNNRSHASKFIIELMADNKDMTTYGKAHQETPITNLLPINMANPAAAAAALEIEHTSHTDSDRAFQYCLGGKSTTLPERVHTLYETDCTDPKMDQARIALVKQIRKDSDILQLDLSLDPYAPSTQLTVDLDGDDEDLGFRFQEGLLTPTIQECEKKTPAGRISTWRSRFRNGTIRSIDTIPVYTITDFRRIVCTKRDSHNTTVTLNIAHEDFAHLHTGNGIPQLHFDQLQSIQHHLNTAKSSSPMGTTH